MAAAASSRSAKDSCSARKAVIRCTPATSRRCPTSRRTTAPTRAGRETATVTDTMPPLEAPTKTARVIPNSSPRGGAAAAGGGGGAPSPAGTQEEKNKGGGGRGRGGGGGGGGPPPPPGSASVFAVRHLVARPEEAVVEVVAAVDLVDGVVVAADHD